MNKSIFTLILLAVFLVFNSFTSVSKEKNNSKIVIRNYNNETGKILFASNGCTACHTASENSIGPGLSIIAKAYKGKKEQLIKFLNKESKPIIVPEDFAIMAANLFLTKKMSQQEKSDLSDYILSHN